MTTIEFKAAVFRAPHEPMSIETVSIPATPPPGDVLVLVGMPSHQTPPWGFGWSQADALRPPFVTDALDRRLEIVSRRLWRAGAWNAYRVRYPGRGIHVLRWNPAFAGIEILRDDGPR